ncbi:TPA: AAA family ATPase [Legionella pneumophila]
MIEQIIKFETGIYKLTNWGNSVPGFRKFNLIYGWNGTGKTTLGNAFYALGHGKETNLKIKWKDSQLKKIKVFNKQFVEENIFKTNSEDQIISPIYIFGEEKVHIQQRIERLKKHWQNKLKLSQQSHNTNDLESVFNKFCSDKASLIKERLRSNDAKNRFNNYDKRNYINDIKKLTETTQIDNKEEILKSVNTTPLPKLDLLNFEIGLSQNEIDQLKNLLSETASANFIESLLEDKEASNWVFSGLELHKERNECLFCNNKISEQRRNKIELHFNNAFKALMEKVDKMQNELKLKKNRLEQVHLPKEAEFYQDFREAYDHIKHEAFIRECIEQLNKAVSLLNKKKNTLHEKLDYEVEFIEIDASHVIKETNELIEKHNKKSDNLDDDINTAREYYATAVLSESLDEFRNYQEAIEKHKLKSTKYTETLRSIEYKINELTKEIRNHRIPAETINQQLKKYLGHGELIFAIKDNGYEIHRNNLSAQHESLCESERTAIALIFFLNSLNDENFKLNEGIVILDDPISSMDNKSIFNAFIFIKEHVKKAYQVFILTHNFEFMNQIKRWWWKNYSEKNKKNAEFFMLRTKFDNSNLRYSELIEMDSLIRDFQSEYHYYFKTIHEFSIKTKQSLVLCMPVPNILRKLMETFTSFQFPDKKNSFNDIFEEDAYDKGIYERFVNVLSHSDSIAAIENMRDHYLQDIPAVCSFVLERIQYYNQSHYDEMIKLLGKNNT